MNNTTSTLYQLNHLNLHDLMADKVLLNTKSDEVFAFDEFDNAFSTF